MGDRKLTKEESELWRAYTRTTKPLHKRPVGEGQEKASAKVKKTLAIKIPTQIKHPPRAPEAPYPNLPLPSLDGATQRRLRRGKQKIEGRLDLHGLRQAEAHDALTKFILFSRHHGRRCVLVITGKGAQKETIYGADGFTPPPGVLRRNVPDWLRSPPLSSHVVGFETAHQRHGGGGALYVILRGGS